MSIITDPPAGNLSGTYLIKFGGNALGGPQDLARLAADIRPILDQGLHVVVVHGGGPEITRVMEERNMTARKVDGIRVTDDAALEVAEEVLSCINAEVVQVFNESGIPAFGMAGHHRSVVTCVKKDPLPDKDAFGREEMVDLINVGEVDGVDTTVLKELFQGGKVPVLYPICVSREGRHMNVNADTLAYSIAVALGCQEMIMITDVPGILMDIDDPRSLLGEASIADIDILIDSGVIKGGMIPKVDGCRKALQAGVKSTRMVNGKDPQSILGDLSRGVRKGTRIYIE